MLAFKVARKFPRKVFLKIIFEKQNKNALIISAFFHKPRFNKTKCYEVLKSVKCLLMKPIFL